MDIQKLADEALHLLEEQRAHLIQRLVSSLDAPSAKELRADWSAEARRRAEELDNGTAQAIAGDDVLKKARALIK
ncbi:addiction module protein [Gilvimarinus agarilyticus]|uniref:addiction module protein n=1 Tax=Gilvimarinus agarilyticus TaxID=679259 RepID=UPI0005A03010|nr:addiction module protein [Gilvimarinus agarilyticus]